MHLACKENAVQAVKNLLSANADISLKNLKGQTSFDLAIDNNCQKVALLLIEDDR